MLLWPVVYVPIIEAIANYVERMEEKGTVVIFLWLKWGEPWSTVSECWYSLIGLNSGTCPSNSWYTQLCLYN